MLELRPSCECRDRGLPVHCMPAGAGAPAAMLGDEFSLHRVRRIEAGHDA